MLDIGVGLVIAIVAVTIVLFVLPRPQDTTAASVFAADGSVLSYCPLFVLDNSGLQASDMPKAYSPDCGWVRWPMPVPVGCTEPLAENAVDMRGIWHSTDSDRPHVERIEQCGNRMVVTAAGIIHDFYADGTLGNGVRDINAASCANIWVAIKW